MITRLLWRRLSVCDTNYLNIIFIVAHFGRGRHLKSGFNATIEKNGYHTRPGDNVKEERKEKLISNARKENAVDKVVVVIRNPFEAIYETYATYEATYAKKTNAYHFFGKGSIPFILNYDRHLCFIHI